VLFLTGLSFQITEKWVIIEISEALEDFFFSLDRNIQNVEIVECRKNGGKRSSVLSGSSLAR